MDTRSMEKNMRKHMKHTKNLGIFGKLQDWEKFLQLMLVIVNYKRSYTRRST